MFQEFRTKILSFTNITKKQKNNTTKSEPMKIIVINLTIVTLELRGYYTGIVDILFHFTINSQLVALAI